MKNIVQIADMVYSRETIEQAMAELNRPDYPEPFHLMEVEEHTRPHDKGVVLRGVIQNAYRHGMQLEDDRVITVLSRRHPGDSYSYRTAADFYKRWRPIE
jgi:hypothetical protein